MDEKEVSEMQEEMMTVLVVEPMKAPYVKHIPNELEDLQQAVGGDIEMTYPFDDEVGILLNGNGKFEGLPLNRALYDDHGQVYDAIAGTFLTIMRRFSEYLRLEYPKVKSCCELDRDILENFLISLSTAEELHSGNSNYVISLRRQLETIGKIYSYENLGHLFINTDTPPETKAEFRVYSDAEMKRLNAEITRMDVQIARCLLIQQMLGTRISDTLTLRTNCLTEEKGQYMVEIYQVKTKRYKKPVSQDVARLLQRSIEYTQEKFQDTKYIFVNEKNPDRPIQYMAIKSKVMSMIQEKQLKDDNGNLFGFGTHMFRHYYGVKLTEMHVDDWTIARLLGHMVNVSFLIYHVYHL